MLKKELKKLIGIELQKCRANKKLRLYTLSELSKISPQQIDALEIGYYRTWNIYQKLLNFYGKKIKIELIDDI